MARRKPKGCPYCGATHWKRSAFLRCERAYRARHPTSKWTKSPK